MTSLSNRPAHDKTALKPLTLLAAASLAFGLAFDLLFFEKLPGVSFPLYIDLVIISLLLIARWQKQKLSKSALYMIPLLVFFSGMVFIRANEFLTFVNVMTSLYLLGLFVSLVAKPDLEKYEFKDYIGLFIKLPLRVARKAKDAMATLLVRHEFITKHKALPGVVRGALFALPILILFVILFSSADLIFRQYVTDLFSFKINAELFWHTGLILVVASGFLGLFTTFMSRQEPAKEATSDKPTTSSRNGVVEAKVLFGSLNALFFCFIIVQLAYLFGGAHNVVGDGFTYAEYARKGFFELIAVAGLSLVLIVVAEHLILKRTDKHGMWFKLLTGGLIAQVIVIMISAFKRMHLYQGAYGFTSLRLFSFLFIFWLAGVFGILLYKIFANKREHVFAFASFVSIIALLVAINAINPDAFVARKNIDRYNKTGKIDLYYLTGLSSDAVKQNVRLLDAHDPVVRNEMAKSLYARKQQLHSEGQDWQSTNVTRSSAMEILDKRVPTDPGQ